MDADGEKWLFTIGKDGILWKLDRRDGVLVDRRETVYQDIFNSIDPTTGRFTSRQDIEGGRETAGERARGSVTDRFPPCRPLARISGGRCRAARAPLCDVAAQRSGSSREPPGAARHWWRSMNETSSPAPAAGPSPRSIRPTCWTFSRRSGTSKAAAREVPPAYPVGAGTGGC